VSNSRKLRAAAAATALSLVLVACGQNDEPTTDPATEPATDPDPTADPDPTTEPTADAQANAADVEFVQGMVPHHEGAIEMSELVFDRTERPELIELAEEIIDVQDAEIDQLRSMLDRMGSEEMPMNDMNDMDGMDHGAMGMMDEQDMQELRGLEGEAFERRFLEGMIRHHEGAIDMAEQARARGDDPEVAELADDVVAAQQTEIDQMRQWLVAWDLT
jgi:uncharacterized protein (DUF305 family)